MRRFRCSTLSQIVFVLLIFSTVKLTILFYNDLQRESANNIGGLSLPIERTQIEWKEKLVTNVDRKQIENLRNFVKEKNEKQKIFNEKIFSSPRTRFVLLIQVHTRIVYLRKFIEMLRSVEKIEETLLIFSHDFIDENINKLVETIDFVPVRKKLRDKPAFVDRRVSFSGDANILSVFSTSLSGRISRRRSVRLSARHHQKQVNSTEQNYIFIENLVSRNSKNRQIREKCVDRFVFWENSFLTN